MGGRLLELTAHHRAQVEQEINRAVTDAITSGSRLRTVSIASRLARNYDRCGLSVDQIASEVARSAAQVGLPVERRTSRAARH